MKYYLVNMKPDIVAIMATTAIYGRLSCFSIKSITTSTSGFTEFFETSGSVLPNVNKNQFYFACAVAAQQMAPIPNSYKIKLNLSMKGDNGVVKVAECC